jgi:hypothetical protein
VSDPPSGGRYEIRVRGLLAQRWSSWFDDLRVEHRGQDTVISGHLPDQAALHGLLTKLRDLGLFLISVTHLGATDDDSTNTRLP